MKAVRMNTHNMRNDEHFQFYTDVSNLIQSEGAENLGVASQFSVFMAAYAKEDEGIKKIVKSVYTKRIREADRARDEIYSGLAEVCHAHTKHPSPVLRAAAEEINVLFSTYGNVSQKPLNEQTSAVYNILQDLEGKYAAQVTALSLLPWVVELKARNIAFGNLVRDRVDEAAAKTTVVVSEARAEVDAAYDVIIERINAFAVIDGGEVYERFIRALNIIIAKYTAIINARRGKGRKGKPEDAGDAQAEDEQANDGAGE